MTRLDFPLPDTPVTQMKVPRGSLTSIPRRLFSRQPKTSKNLPLPARRDSGTGIARTPDRYWPVRERGSAMTSSRVPAATISPP